MRRHPFALNPSLVGYHGSIGEDASAMDTSKPNVTGLVFGYDPSSADPPGPSLPRSGSPRLRPLGVQPTREYPSSSDPSSIDPMISLPPTADSPRSQPTGEYLSSLDPSSFDISNLDPSILLPPRSGSPKVSSPKVCSPKVCSPKVCSRRVDLSTSDPSSLDPSISGSHRLRAHDFSTDSEIEDRIVYENLSIEDDIEILRSWIKKRYETISECKYLKDEVKRLISLYVPNFKPAGCDSPKFLIDVLKNILHEADMKWKLFNVPLDKLGTLEGSNIAAKIESHKHRLSSIIQSLEFRVKKLDDEVSGYRLQNMELVSQLRAAEDHIRVLESKDKEAGTSEELSFMRGLHMKMKQKNIMQSSLMGEIQREKHFTERLKKDLLNLEGEIMKERQERIKEIAEFAKESELNEDFRNSLLQKIKIVTPDPVDCERAINDWMNKIQMAFEGMRVDIERTKEEAKSVNDELAECYVHVANLTERRNSLAFEAENLAEDIEERERTCRELQRYVRQLDEQELSLSTGADNREQGSINTSFRASTPSRFGSLRFIDSSDESRIEELMGSPERFRKNDPSNYSPRGFDSSRRPLDESSPLSLDSSQHMEIPSFTFSAPSPIELNTEQSIFMPSFCSGPIDPGTQTISEPRSIILPEKITVDPSTQNITGVKKRLYSGQTFEMQTDNSQRLSPYSQVAQMDSTVPRAGPSHMVDTPVHSKHMAELTPSQFVTPFISTTRFGYTDPKAKVLNLPPGDDLDIGTSMRKKLLLTSSQRKEPLIVNIDVDPQPLVQTQSGEHFICDITLDVQEAGKDKKHISPVFTYGAPPAVTPTSTRRYGQFTPRGIFRKKHFNIRKVIGPQYESPGEYFSPHYLPYDSRSPISSIPPPFYVSDSSISWEKIPGLDTTFDASTSPVMNRTFEASATPVMNRTFEASPHPIMNRTFDAPPHPVMNRTFDASPHPVMNRTFDASPHPVTNRTFDQSPSPLARGPTYRWRSSPLNRTFDQSSSPVLNETFDRSLSPGLERTFNRNQSSMIPHQVLDTTFDRSLAPIGDRSYNMTSSPLFHSSFDSNRYEPDMTFDSTSPVSNQMLDQRSFSKSYGTFDRSVSPRLDGTFDHSLSQRLDNTYDRSMSPRLNNTFDRSVSPRSNFTFDRSISPRLDGTFDRSI